MFEFWSQDRAKVENCFSPSVFLQANRYPRGEWHSPPCISRGHNFAMVTPQTDSGSDSSNPSSRPSPPRPSQVQPMERSAGELSWASFGSSTSRFSFSKSVLLHHTTSYPIFASSPHHRATNDYTVVFNVYTHLYKASAKPGGRRGTFMETRNETLS